ncbi:UbiA family prenyltransferase [Burkholderia gladioli]|uniref:UbiA family prenyltransferase n=1 Tax=Burkholderia gladioli TaxID=28095 RepID=UPI00163F68E7|nr:UbiA family prenyltransferase [Burkholderia gladioli]
MQADKILVVDLDGTLIQSDMLVESGLAYLKRWPHRFYRPLLWLLEGGKAGLKQRLAEAAGVDVTSLPYNGTVLEWLRAERSQGRPITLATASASHYANAIAGHLGLFDRTFASDGAVNLSADNKRDALVGAYGDKGFDYVGNSRDDLSAWRAAERAYVVNAPKRIAREAQRNGNVEHVIDTRAGTLRVWAHALRLHQWLKNLLVFVPLFAAHRAGEPTMFWQGLLAFLAFGLCASSVYVLNDLVDLDDDRHHPVKRHRPFASGALSLLSGAIAFPLLLAASLAIALSSLPSAFSLALAAYYALTVAYSFVLKRMVIVDVIALAALYTARLAAGTAAFGMRLSFWLLAFSMCIFLSLALVKRYTELVALAGGQARGRGYVSDDRAIVLALGAAAGYLSVLVLALYIQDPATLMLYANPQRIWLSCPLLLYWVSRTWIITNRGQMNSDPVLFAATDATSLGVAALFVLVFVSAI